MSGSAGPGARKVPRGQVIHSKGERGARVIGPVRERTPGCAIPDKRGSGGKGRGSGIVLGVPHTGDQTTMHTPITPTVLRRITAPLCALALTIPLMNAAAAPQESVEDAQAARTIEQVMGVDDGFGISLQTSGDFMAAMEP